MNLNTEQAAQALKIPTYQLQDLVEGKSKIDLETAYRLGRYFQIEPELFLNLQQRYDFEVWKDRQEGQIKRQVKPRLGTPEKSSKNVGRKETNVR